MKITYTYTITFQIFVSGFALVLYKLRKDDFPIELMLAIGISLLYTFMLTYDILTVIFIYMEIIKSLKRVKFSKNIFTSFLLKAYIMTLAHFERYLNIFIDQQS